MGSNKECFLNNLRFADDIVILAKNRNELEIMAEDLRRESAKVGLSMNLSKTKIITNIENFEYIKLEGREVEVVSEYKYLGQVMSFENRTKN